MDNLQENERKKRKKTMEGENENKRKKEEVMNKSEKEKEKEVKSGTKSKENQLKDDNKETNMLQKVKKEKDQNASLEQIECLEISRDAEDKKLNTNFEVHEMKEIENIDNEHINKKKVERKVKSDNNASKEKNEELNEVGDKEDKNGNKKVEDNVFDEEEHAIFSTMVLNME